jgi:hypothetical protein
VITALLTLGKEKKSMENLSPGLDPKIQVQEGLTPISEMGISQQKVEVTAAQPESFTPGIEWEKTNIRRTPGELMKEAIKEYNTQTNQDPPIKIDQNVIKIEVNSFDRNSRTTGSSGQLEVGRDPEDGTALLSVEYCMTVKRDDGSEIKIHVPQQWKTDCTVPTPGTSEEKSFAIEVFERELQTIFLGIKVKVMSVCEATKNPDPTATITINMKKLNALSSKLDWSKNALFSHAPGQLYGKTVSDLSVGSLGKLSSHQIVMGYRVNNVFKKTHPTTGEEFDPVYNYTIKCKELDDEKQRLTDVETIVQQKAGKSEKNDATQRLSSVLKNDRTKKEVLRAEIEMAGDRLMEITGVGLSRDKGEVVVTHSLDRELKGAELISKKLAENKERRAKLSEEKVHLMEDFREIKGEKAKDPTREENRQWLIDRGAAPELQEAYRDLRATLQTVPLQERSELAIRLKLNDVMNGIYNAEGNIENLQNLNGYAQEILVSTKTRLETNFEQLEKHILTLEEIRTLLPNNDPDIKEIDTGIRKLKDALSHTGYANGDIKRSINGFKEKIEKAYPTRQASVKDSQDQSLPPDFPNMPLKKPPQPPQENLV